MHITMISPECAPVAKVGGLADVVFGLAKDQKKRGNIVETILPKYDCLRYDGFSNLTQIADDLQVGWQAGAVRCSIWSAGVAGQDCLLIEPHSRENYFGRGVI